MAGLQSTLSDTAFENWVKAGLSLQYTKDGIENFVDTVIDNLNKVIMNSLPIGVTCSNCTTENITICARNNNFCKFAGRKCLVHDQNIANKCYRPCPSNVCDKIRDEIIANHRYSKPAWQNTDARQWCTNRWKIAVCYMSIGYSQQTSARETDLPGLISCIINNTYFQTYVADNLSDDNNLFRQARTSRNDILHNPGQRLTQAELRAHIATFTAVLTDTKYLSTDINAIAAITKLQQSVNNTISITTQHAGQILADAFNSIRDAVDDVEDLKENTIKSISDVKDSVLDAFKVTNDKITQNIKKTGEEALKPVTDAKDKALDAIKGTNYEITENIKKTGEEALKPMTDAKDKAFKIEKRTLKRMAKEEEKSLSAIKKTKYDHIQSMTDKSKQLTNEHSETLIEKKNELVAEITNMTNTDTQEQQYLSSIKEIRQELVSLYQTEARFLTTPIYPLIQHRNRNIEDLYVPQSMRTVDKETMEPIKEVNSIEDLFRDNSKNIYVVGDAGMGKSSLCKKIVSDWCKSKSDNATSHTLSTDQKYMQELSFVFYISLRDCNTDLNIIDMIKHQLLEEICGCDDKTLISMLRKEKCLIVLDGLDEWTPKGIQNTAYSSYSPVMVPGRKGVRNCLILTTTRPWKLEAIRLESSQIDKHIELLGIGKDSHEAFVRYMVKQMNPGIDIDSFLSSFIDEVRKKNLKHFLSIPVILKQLVCIMNKCNELRETQTSVYSQMLNLLFEIAHSRLQDNANYKVIKSTETSMNIKLPKCFAEDKKCIEFVLLLCPLSKLAFETLLSDTPETSLVFETSTTAVHGLTHEQVNLCLDIGILSQTKYLTKQNYLEEHTKISFLHKTYQEFLAALWLSLETNDENKQTNFQTFKNKCSTITSMLELSEFLIFVSGMNSKTACELSKHTREIITQSDIIRNYRRQSLDLGNKPVFQHVQKLIISYIKEGWECSHSDCHLYLEDFVLDKPYARDEEDIDVKDRLIKINKSNIKSMYVNDASVQSHDNSLLEVSGLEKLSLNRVRDEAFIQRLISQSNNTISTLLLCNSVFNNVGILQSTRCLTRLSLNSIQLSHIDKLGVMSYLSQTHRMKEIKLHSVECKECGDDECRPVLDLSQHDQLEYLSLQDINVAIDTVVSVTNMVKCELSHITPVMSFVKVTKGLHNAPKLKVVQLYETETPEGAAAIVECISHQKHIERLHLYEIDFRSCELVLSPDYRNLEYFQLLRVTMTKRSFRCVIDSILACNQAVHVDVYCLYIKPEEDLQDIVDYVRHSSRCQVMEDEDHEVGEIGKFIFKTIPKQQTLFGTHSEVHYAFMSFRTLETSQLEYNTILRAHALRVMGTVDKCINRLDHCQKLHYLMTELGIRHKNYMVKMEYIDLIGPAFILSIMPQMEEIWTCEHQIAWDNLFALMSYHMTKGMCSI